MASTRICIAMTFAFAMAALAVSTWCGCAVESSTDFGSDGKVRYVEASDLPASSDGDGGSSESGDASAAEPSASESATRETAPSYPIGWLAAPSGEIPSGTPLAIRHLPDIEIQAHRDGAAVAEDEQHRLDENLPEADASQAIVEYEGKLLAVDADDVLVNLPDVLPQAEYDIVYSYASTSECAGQPIPGVTGMRIEGYAEGKQTSFYQGCDQFAVPCAYRTALKAMAACEQLDKQGYRLLVFDAYRPITAQLFLSDAFEQACSENETMAESLGAWPLAWYVASGASGHNYGTDLDVGVCDKDGSPLPMPSAFDAFDESGHLTDEPMDSGSISPESYREAVAGNTACTALHAAFTEAGFSELASEWWHFGDEETETEMRAIAGDQGLDFVALLG